MEYGIVSLLPTALVLALAIKTRRTLGVRKNMANAWSPSSRAIILPFLIMDGVGFVDTLKKAEADDLGWGVIFLDDYVLTVMKTSQCWIIR